MISMPLFLLLLGICSFGQCQQVNSTLNSTNLRRNETFLNDPFRIFRLPFIFPEFFEVENETNAHEQARSKEEEAGFYYSPFFQHFFPDLFRTRGNLTEKTGIIDRNAKPCSTRIIIRTITQNIQEKPKRFRKMDNLALIFPHLKWIMLLLFIWIVFALIGIGTLRKVNNKITEARCHKDPSQRC